MGNPRNTNLFMRGAIMDMKIDPKYLEFMNRPVGQVTIFELAEMFGFTPPLIFQTPQWCTDDKAALAEAKKAGKIVFALFTGTNWCIYCKYLENEVISTGTFLTWAHQKVVLLKVDFPKPGLPSSHPSMKLASKYKVSGFPTAIGLNADGSERGRHVGYSSGTGPQIWLSQFETNAKMNSSTP